MKKPRRPVLRRRGLARLALWPLLALLAAPAARAHNLGDSYLYLQIYEDSITGRFEIALSDLNPALGLSGTELEITPSNLDSRIGFLKNYYREKVILSDDSGPLSIRFTDHELLNARGGYVLLPFEFTELIEPPEKLTIDYSVLFDEDPSHRGFLLVEHNWATGTFANENQVSLVFSPSARRQVFDLTSSGRLRGFLALAKLGAEHMLLGLDHIFFLIALLLPIVLRHDGGRWRPVDRAAPAVRGALAIVTAFAAAHTVAFLLATLAGVHPAEALVETVIAASIAVAALHILRPFFGKRLWWIVFGFGVFHGFGFAAALADLGVLGDHLGLSLIAFNLGVEVGQVAIVAISTPILFLVRRLRLYRKLALPVAAVLLILLSSIWVVERAFGMDVPLRELLPASVQKVIP